MFRTSGEEGKVVKKDARSNAVNNWQLPGLMCSVLPVKWQLGPAAISWARTVNTAVTHTLTGKKANYSENQAPSLLGLLHEMTRPESNASQPLGTGEALPAQHRSLPCSGEQGMMTAGL